MRSARPAAAVVVAAALATSVAAAPAHATIRFDTQSFGTDTSEPALAADVDNDGISDVLVGPRLYRRSTGLGVQPPVVAVQPSDINGRFAAIADVFGNNFLAGPDGF